MNIVRFVLFSLFSKSMVLFMISTSIHIHTFYSGIKWESAVFDSSTTILLSLSPSLFFSLSLNTHFLIRLKTFPTLITHLQRIKNIRCAVVNIQAARSKPNYRFYWKTHQTFWSVLKTLWMDFRKFRLRNTWVVTFLSGEKMWFGFFAFDLSLSLSKIHIPI